MAMRASCFAAKPIGSRDGLSVSSTLYDPCDVGSRHNPFRNSSAICTALRRARQELIGRDEHRERVTRGVAEILADAAGQNVVLA